MNLADRSGVVRAFSPRFALVSFTGALPRTGMSRAVGAHRLVRKPRWTAPRLECGRRSLLRVVQLAQVTKLPLRSGLETAVGMNREPRENSGPKRDASAAKSFTYWVRVDFSPSPGPFAYLAWFADSTTAF